MFSHIQSFVKVLKVFGFSVFFIWISSILNNFAPLKIKPKHFSLGFSGSLRSFFVILLRAYLFSIIFQCTTSKQNRKWKTGFFFLIRFKCFRLLIIFVGLRIMKNKARLKIIIWLTTKMRSQTHLNLIKKKRTVFHFQFCFPFGALQCL